MSQEIKELDDLHLTFRVRVSFKSGSFTNSSTGLIENLLWADFGFICEEWGGSIDTPNSILMESQPVHQKSIDYFNFIRSYIQNQLPNHIRYQVEKIVHESRLDAREKITGKRHLDFARWLKKHSQFIDNVSGIGGKRVRLDHLSGGKYNKKVPFQTPQEESQFVREVQDVLPLWKYIRKTVRMHDFDPEEKLFIVQRKEYIKLSQDQPAIPKKLLNLAFTRSHTTSLKHQPLGLALMHIAESKGLNDVAVETLKKIYQRLNKVNQK